MELHTQMHLTNNHNPLFLLLISFYFPRAVSVKEKTNLVEQGMYAMANH